MSLSSVLLGIWLVLVGLSWAGIVSIGTSFLGFWALISGVLWLIELYHPLWKR